MPDSFALADDLLQFVGIYDRCNIRFILYYRRTYRRHGSESIGTVNHLVLADNDFEPDRFFCRGNSIGEFHFDFQTRQSGEHGLWRTLPTSGRRLLSSVGFARLAGKRVLAAAGNSVLVCPQKSSAHGRFFWRHSV